MVTLDSYPDWRIAAKVIAIIPTADRQKATVKVRIGFDQLDPRILPDMGLKVEFQGVPGAASGPRVVLVPRAAVNHRDGRDMVWVVRGDRVERRAVAVEAMLDSEVSLSGGLEGGERVVVEGAESLADGARVAEKHP